MSQSKKRLFFLASAVVLSIGLYFSLAEKKDSKEDQNEQNKITSSVGYSFEVILSEAKKQLTKEQLVAVNKAEDDLKANSSAATLQIVGKLWDEYQVPPVSSHYFEQIAILNPEEKTWIEAAYRYFDAYNMSADSSLRQAFIRKAIVCYENASMLNPKNLDVKTDLGISYAQEGSNPMKGIMLLREVVQENPEHEMAQYNLGILSVKSGQLEKAVERFEKVMTINPKRTEARYLLARTYADLGKKEAALKNFELVKKEVSDPQLAAEIDKIIKQIK